MVMPRKLQEEKGLKTIRCISPDCEILNLYTDLDYCSACKTPFKDNQMKMDGYDIIRTHDNGSISVTYAVYTMDKGKHYRNGYSSYKSMIAAHPELKR